MTPLFRYLEADILPGDYNEARKVKKQAARFYISQEKLYQRSFSGPYLRCVTQRQKPLESLYNYMKEIVDPTLAAEAWCSEAEG